MLTVNVICKLSGNYTAHYGSGQTTTNARAAAPKPAPRTKSPAPVKVRTSTPRRGKQATPAQAGEIYATLKDICDAHPEAGGMVTMSLEDYVKQNPTYGDPHPGDVYTIATLKSAEHNGLLIPKLEKHLPAYVITNQKNEIVKLLDGRAKPETASEMDLYHGFSVDMEVALKQLKRIKKYIACIGKPKAETPEEITITARAVAENVYRFQAGNLTAQLKNVSRNANIIINKIAFPARVFLDVLKLLKNEIVTLSIFENIKTLEIAYTQDGLRGKATIKSNFTPEGKFIHVNYQTA